ITRERGFGDTRSPGDVVDACPLKTVAQKDRARAFQHLQEFATTRHRKSLSHPQAPLITLTVLQCPQNSNSDTRSCLQMAKPEPDAGDVDEAEETVCGFVVACCQ